MGCRHPWLLQGVPLFATDGKPSLARALDWFRSPSTLQLVELFLAHGADPLQPHHNGPGAGPILQVALEKWLRTPQNSQLRPWFRQAFERIARHTSAEVFLEMFPPQALEQLALQYPTEFPHFQQMVMERKTAQAPSTRTHKVRLQAWSLEIHGVLRYPVGNGYHRHSCRLDHSSNA